MDNQIHSDQTRVEVPIEFREKSVHQTGLDTALERFGYILNCVSQAAIDVANINDRIYGPQPAEPSRPDAVNPENQGALERINVLLDITEQRLSFLNGELNRLKEFI